MYGVDMTKPGAQAYYDSVSSPCSPRGASTSSRSTTSPRLSTTTSRNRGDAHARSTRPAGRWSSACRRARPPWTRAPCRGPREYVADQRRFLGRMALPASSSRGCDNWAPYRARAGAWPDADMLPLGAARIGPRRSQLHARRAAHADDPLVDRALAPDHGRRPARARRCTGPADQRRGLAVNQHSRDNRQLFNRDGRYAWAADVPDPTISTWRSSTRAT